MYEEINPVTKLINMSTSALNIGTPLITNIIPKIIFKIRQIAPIAIAKLKGVIDSSWVNLSSVVSLTSIPLSLDAKIL